MMPGGFGREGLAQTGDDLEKPGGPLSSKRKCRALGRRDNCVVLQALPSLDNGTRQHFSVAAGVLGLKLRGHEFKQAVNHPNFHHVTTGILQQLSFWAWDISLFFYCHCNFERH